MELQEHIEKVFLSSLVVFIMRIYAVCSYIRCSSDSWYVQQNYTSNN
jgi:hypothetical protein